MTKDERRTTTDERRMTTDDRRPTNDDRRPTTDDRRPTDNGQRTTRIPHPSQLKIVVVATLFFLSQRGDCAEWAGLSLSDE
jgi:hypothetical protein